MIININRKIPKKAIPTFLEIMRTDPNNRVKDTTAWAIAKAAEFHPISIKDNLVPVLETLVISLNSDPNVASQACYALLNVIQLFSDSEDNTQLTNFFPPLLDALIRASERPDGDQFNLRITAYESINALVQNSPDDVLPIILKLVELLIDRLTKTFIMDVRFISFLIIILLI